MRPCQGADSSHRDTNWSNMRTLLLGSWWRVWWSQVQSDGWRVLEKLWTSHYITNMKPNTWVLLLGKSDPLGPEFLVVIFTSQVQELSGLSGWSGNIEIFSNNLLPITSSGPELAIRSG